MSKFKIGDRVEIVKACECKYWDDDEPCRDKYLNKLGVIKGIEEKRGWDVELENSKRSCWFYEHQLKLEVKMSKYNELKGRIEALNNGWDKEANEIIAYIDFSNYKYRIAIPITNHGSIKILSNDGRPKSKVYFSNSFETQCSKNTAFKKALLWLLDHSDIKKVDQEKIDKLQSKIDDMQKELDDMKGE